MLNSKLLVTKCRLSEMLDRQGNRRIIADALNVDVIYNMASALYLPGSHAIIISYSDLINPSMPSEQIEGLSEILNLPIKASTVNNMSIDLGSGIASNDTTAFLGINSTPKEILAEEHLLEKPECHTEWYRWYRSMTNTAKYASDVMDIIGHTSNGMQILFEIKR